MAYVGLGRRFVAWLLDLAIAGLWIAALGEYETGPSSFEARWTGWRFVVAWILLPVLYYVLFEWLLSATPGKFVLGVRVRAAGGGRIGFTQSLVRNVARLVDAFPYAIPYIVGAIAISNSPTKQRLGDRWGKTVVILWGSDRAIPQPIPPMPADAPALSGPADDTSELPPAGTPEGPPIPPPPPPA
jgi:uncharacterized RDD family membrane protein YckC